jgi:hypothetical protein
MRTIRHSWLPAFAVAGILAIAASTSAQIEIGLLNGRDDAISLYKDARGAELQRNADILRRRMLGWKERDFRTLFGAPVLRGNGRGQSLDPGGDVARLSTEPKGVEFSGLRLAEIGKDHTDLYDIGSNCRIEVFFGFSGLPVYVSFFLKTDNDFALLSDSRFIDSRLAWERPRFEAAAREIDSLWRRNVVWEVDRDEQRKKLTGLNSTDPDEIWLSLQEWGNRLGYRLSPSSELNGVTNRRWYDGSMVMGEATLRKFDRGGQPAKNLNATIHQSNGSGVRLTFGSNLVGFIGWLRPDGSYIRIDGSVGECQEITSCLANGAGTMQQAKAYAENSTRTATACPTACGKPACRRTHPCR